MQKKDFLNDLSKRIKIEKQAYTKFSKDVETNTMSLSENISKNNKLESEYNILGIESLREKISYMLDTCINLTFMILLICQRNLHKLKKRSI